MFGDINLNSGMTINPKEVKSILTESYDTIKNIHGVDPMVNFNDVILKDNIFRDYITSLTEGADRVTSEFIKKSAEPLRKQIFIEATTFGTINPYQKMIFPLIRVYFPRLVAKEAVTLDEIDAPAVTKYFIKYIMKDRNGNVVGNIPNYNARPSMPIPSTPIDINFNGNVKDLVGVDTEASVERLFKVVSVQDADGNVTEVNIQAAVDGGIYSGEITLGNGSKDVLVGNINFKTGELTLMAVQGNIKKAVLFGAISTELNDNNRKAELTTEKINIETKEKELQTNWTIELEQDAKALLDIDIKSEMISILGAQIATEIDEEVISDIIAIAESHHSSAIDNFTYEPPASYAFGTKSWHENVIPVINKISNIIYTDTNIGQGNVILVNPIDAVIFQSINGYTSMGNPSEGDMGLQGGSYEIGSLNNKWKILTSPLVPQGKAPILLKSNNEKEAVYTLYYYQPLYIQPFPLGSVPSLTLKSRYAKQVIRPKGIGLLNIV